MKVQVRRKSDLQPRDAEAIAEFVSSSAGAHFNQFPFLPRIESARPADAYVVWVDDAGGVRASAVIRIYRAGRFGPRIARADRGPVVESPEALELLLAQVEDVARRAGAVAVRANPYTVDGSVPALDAVFAQRGFRPVADSDYDRSLEVDLTKGPEEILRTFRKTTRSEIQRAQRAGLRCEAATDTSQAEIFADHYESMVARKGASPRPRDMFLALADHLLEHPDRGFHLVSYHETRVLAGIFVTRHADRAIYAFGASADDPDRLPKAHLLQWEAMLCAREMGCTRYDLGGFSAGTGQDGTRSSTQAVNVFKSGFAKTETRFSPCRELVLRPWSYRTLRLARRLKAKADRLHARGA